MHADQRAEPTNRSPAARLLSLAPARRKDGQLASWQAGETTKRAPGDDLFGASIQLSIQPAGEWWPAPAPLSASSQLGARAKSLSSQWSFERSRPGRPERPIGSGLTRIDQSAGRPDDSSSRRPLEWADHWERAEARSRAGRRTERSSGVEPGRM